MDIRLKTEFDLDNDIKLRAWTEDDIEAALDIVLRNREHLQQFMHWMTPDYSAEHARKFLTESIAARKDRKSLGLAIVHASVLIGSIGFVEFDWKGRKTEIGYWIDKNVEGRGIVTRATRLLIDYAFNELKMNRIEIQCSAENIRSAAIPERLGFKLEGYLRQSEFRNGKLHDFKIYGLLADDPRLW